MGGNVNKLYQQVKYTHNYMSHRLFIIVTEQFASL